MYSYLSHTDQDWIPNDAAEKKGNSSIPGVVTAAKPTGVTDFLVLCHATYRAQRSGDGPPQRELDAFLEPELVMSPQPLRPGLNWRKAIPWACDTSKWASRRFTMIFSVYLCVADFTEIFTVQTLSTVSLFFSLGIKKY